MSVLKSRRTESKAKYIYTANKIYAETIRFLSRLSARYSRLMSDSVAKLASEVVDNCEKANSIYPSSDMRKQLREKHLLEARASLMALDLHLFHIYDILITNPEGCFATCWQKARWVCWMFRVPLTPPLRTLTSSTIIGLS